MSDLQRHAGINVTDSKLQLVEIHLSGDGFLLYNADEAYYNEPVNFKNEKTARALERMQEAYDELNVKRAVEAESASVTLPVDLFYIAQLPYDPTLLRQDMIEEFRWEFSLLYPFLDPAELTFQVFEIEESYLNTYPNTAVVAASPRRYLRLVSEFCERNHLEPRFVDNAHFAADRALSRVDRLEKGVILSLYFADNVLSIEVLSDGLPVFVKLIRLRNAGEIVKQAQRALFNNPRFYLKKELIDFAFIGGDHLSAPLVKRVERDLDLKFKQVNPFQRLKIAPEIRRSRAVGSASFSFLAATGVATRLA
ncbi:MAG: hypothetical protein GF419_11175 [Ignavibacteriales bacterium]|nr:hypothetical protein [Ignavibacteriales bacterium]